MAHNLWFVDHAEGLGGAEHNLLLFLKRLDRARWQPHLACAGGPLAEEAARLEVPVHTLFLPRLRRSPRFLLDWLTGARVIAGLARRSSAHLLIANTVRAAFYTALAARLAGVPFVWHMQDFWLSESRPRHLWADRLGKRLLCATAVKVIANSGATASHLPCPKKTVVVLNGIEVDRFDPTMDGAPFRRQHGIPIDAPLVGTVGRLRPWKGQDRFLRVLARVREAIPEVWGMVVGGTPLAVPDDYPQRLHRLADDLGLRKCVIFTGHLADPRPALAAMDVFVHPGDPEPFGLVNVEAMAMGKPVVAFAHGALPEIIVDGQTGLLVPPEDETAMVNGVVGLLRDPARRSLLGRAGRARVEEHFTVERMAAQVTAVFHEAIACVSGMGEP